MRSFHLVTAGVVAIALSGAAVAEFVPGEWSLGNVGDSSMSTQLAVGATVTLTGPANVFGSGSVTPTLMSISSGNAGVKGVTRFLTTAAARGTVTFTWTYQSFDMPCYDNGGYVVNGLFKVIACNGSGPFAGTTSFAVNAGDSFGFGARTGDGLESSGTLKVTSLVFTPPSADLDGDGVVGAADLAILLGQWGAGGAADIDGSGAVDAADLSMLLGQWG